MLVRDLIDYLLREVNTGRLKGTDKVPAELIRCIDDGHIGVAEYLAGKYDITRGADVGGQEDAEAVHTSTKGD